MEATRLTLSEVEEIAFKALSRSGASDLQASALAKGVVGAERDGISSHGLVYVPTYCQHLQCGKVDGQAKPKLEQLKSAGFRVDADCGFAHAAIEEGFSALIPAARESGCAALAIHNSYNCGVLAFHTEKLAAQGLLGLGFTNAPSSIAPQGGNSPVIGTNPFSMAVPGANGIAFCIDQSASVVAKSEIMACARRGESIPDHWAKDAEGNPTTDPEVALKGSMSPSGGYKGFGVGLMVEVLAAAVSGAHLGMNASPFSGTVGGPPKTGQFFIALDPLLFSNGSFAGQIGALCEAIASQSGAQLPGQKRAAHREVADRDGITVSSELVGKVNALPD